MSLEEDLYAPDVPVRDMSRYGSLGMLANPFETDESEEPEVDCETAAAGNRLLGAIWSKSNEEAPKPLWVEKPAELPASYALAAEGHAEMSLAADDSLNVLYAYVQLFMMKIGPVRSTLNVLAERLAFRDFDRTLSAYLKRVVDEPDEELASYQLLGPERLADFSAKYSSDPATTVDWVFGSPEVERRPELAQVADLRHLSMDQDGDEADTTAEIDSTVGDAPGTQVLLAEAAEKAGEDASAVFDYIIDYTRAHVSPVVARGLRVYRDRGLAALADELKITKAPRKTLGKLIEFSSVRYHKVVLMYDGFQNWMDIDQDLRSKLAGSMAEIRWKTAGGAIPVMLMAPDEAPEIEETFGHGDRLEWRFSNLVPMYENKDQLIEDAVNEWLAAAALPGTSPLTLDDPVLSRVRAATEGSMRRFIPMAAAAIEDAADRGVSELDEAAYEAAMQGTV